MSASFFIFFLILSRIKNSKGLLQGGAPQAGRRRPTTHEILSGYLSPGKENPCECCEGRLAACMLACWAPPIDIQPHSAQRARSGRHARPAARAAARGPREGAKAAPAGLSARRAVQVAAARGATAAHIQKFSCRAFAMGNKMRGPFYPLSRGALRPAKAVARRPPRPGRVRSL